MRFTDDAKPILSAFIKSQVGFCIRESSLIAEERNVSTCETVVTPSDVTEAINSIKARHPVHKRKTSIIIADIFLVLSSLGAESVFTFNVFEKHWDWACAIIVITCTTFICLSFFKIFRDSNYTGKGE